MSNKVIKSVSFNIKVADDKAMMKHFSRRNFSGYVKKLILQDMKSKGVEVVEELTVKEEAPAAVPSAREQIERMRQQRQPAPPKLILPKQ